MPIKNPLKIGYIGNRKESVYPKSMANTTIRFIRLKYDSYSWDNNMGLGADHNLLVQLHKLTDFKIAENSESISIAQLQELSAKEIPYRCHYDTVASHNTSNYLFSTSPNQLSISTQPF